MRTSALLLGVLVLCSAILAVPPAIGETFGPNVRVNESTNLDRNVPAITVGWDGIVYATWQDKGSGYWRIMLAHAPASGGVFTGHMQVATSPPLQSIEQSPDIGYWNETVFVVWQDNRSWLGNDVYFASLMTPGGIAQPEKKINDETWPGSRQAPTMAVAPNGTIYVAYSNESVHVRLVASYDGGRTWTPSSLISSSTANTRGEQRAAVDPWGKVYVVWRDGRSGMIDRPGGLQVEDDDVYIANSTDGGRTFGPDSPVNDVIAGKVQSSPSIAIDGYGRVHVAWKDERFEPNEATDIFYARSDNGKDFGPNIPVNNSSPVEMSPRRTTHQQPWIAVDPPGKAIFVAWVDDRSRLDNTADPNHNVYVAKSVDGGRTFIPANLAVSGANYFIDDISSYNGVCDVGEVTILDNGNGLLDPGLLNGSPDSVVQPGRANLQQDLTGDYLRYRDANSNGNWDSDEDIVMNGPNDTYPGVQPSFIAPWDTTGYTDFQISLLYFSDTIGMKVESGETLALDGFDTDGAETSPYDPTKTGLKPGDPISSARLEVTYRANITYTGTGTVNWSLEGGANNTWFAPVETGDNWTNESLDIYALGATTVPDLKDLNVSFVNNGAGNVSVDRIALNVTKGILTSYDSLDTMVYNGSTATALGDALSIFSTADKIVFVDVNMTGRYMGGEPIIHTSTVIGAGGILRPTDEVLRRADGPAWRTLFNPFPVNDDPPGSNHDPPGSNHFMTRLALNPFDYLNLVWQDWRRGTGPDIYAATAQTVESHGPWMAFWSETDRRRAGPGGTVQYRIMVRNIGGVAAAHVNVSATLPPGLDFVASNPPPDSLVAGNPAWDLGFTSSMASVQIVVGARVNATVPLNTVLLTHATLNFTDLLTSPRPEMYAHLSFIASDLIPPVIAHTPPAEVRAGTELRIVATVTDDSRVSEVRLFVKPVGAGYYNELEMARVGASDEFEKTISVGQEAGTLQYYIEADDIFANIAKSPAGAPSEFYHVRVVGGGLPILSLIAGLTAFAAGIVIVTLLVLMRRRKRKEAEEEQEEEEMAAAEEEKKEPPPF